MNPARHSPRSLPAFSRIDESACNPKPKNLRQGERNPFNVVHDDLANYTYNVETGQVKTVRLDPQIAKDPASLFLSPNCPPSTHLDSIAVWFDYLCRVLTSAIRTGRSPFDFGTRLLDHVTGVNAVSKFH